MFKFESTATLCLYTGSYLLLLRSELRRNSSMMIENEDYSSYPDLGDFGALFDFNLDETELFEDVQVAEQNLLESFLDDEEEWGKLDSGSISPVSQKLWDDGDRQSTRMSRKRKLVQADVKSTGDTMVADTATSDPSFSSKSSQLLEKYKDLLFAFQSLVTAKNSESADQVKYIIEKYIEPNCRVTTALTDSPNPGDIQLLFDAISSSIPDFVVMMRSIKIMPNGDIKGRIIYSGTKLYDHPEDVRFDVLTSDSCDADLKAQAAAILAAGKRCKIYGKANVKLTPNPTFTKFAAIEMFQKYIALEAVCPMTVGGVEDILEGRNEFVEDTNRVNSFRPSKMSSTPPTVIGQIGTTVVVNRNASTASSATMNTVALSTEQSTHE